MVVYTGLALFAGAGGLELGLKLALGDRYKCVAYVERSIEAASVLATNMERPEAGLDKGVIWDDVTTFTGDVVSPFVDRIDIVSAGFNCQPWSYAGARRKTDDERWLWPNIVEILGTIHPEWAFFENVPGLLRGGLGPILSDLTSLGFGQIEWTSVRANDERIGAPHKRERLFILAHADNAGSPSPGSGVNRIGSKENEGRAEQPQPEPRGSGKQLVNPIGKRGRGWHTSGEYAEHAFPPGPSASAEWKDILSQRPDIAPAVESEVRGVADGVARGLARTQQLRILGNGVVPQQAALAFQILKERIDGSTTTSK